MQKRHNKARSHTRKQEQNKHDRAYQKNTEG